MPRSYTPRDPDLDPCPVRSLSELEDAASVLGDTAVLGCELSFELQSLDVNPTHPSRAGGRGVGAAKAFVLLQGMLVAERWLIEFLTGPATFVDSQTQKRRKRDGDICVDCFVHDWRFPPGQLADELVARLGPINTLAVHPTWAQVTASPRQWTLNRVARCVDGLVIFADAVRRERPTGAAVLEERIAAARRSLRTWAERRAEVVRSRRSLISAAGADLPDARASIAAGRCCILRCIWRARGRRFT